MELGGDDALHANFLACPATSDRYSLSIVSIDSNDKKLRSRDLKRATSSPRVGKFHPIHAMFL
jgi:hypothetical protein